MGTAAITAEPRRLVERFDLSRRVFQSGDYREEQLPKARTPHEQQTLKRTSEATDEQIDQPVYELHGLTEKGIGILEEAQS